MPDEPFRDPLAELMGEANLGSCLDLASGRGAFSGRLAELAPAASWILLDTDAQQLRDARAGLGPELGAPLLTLQARAERAPVAAASLDTVTLSFSLHHLRRPGRVLREACRLLKPGGRLILAEPLADGLLPLQTIHRDLHHLSARLDRQLGRCHRPTYPLRALRRLLDGLPLAWRSTCWRPAVLPPTETARLAPVLDTLSRLDAELHRRRLPELRCKLAAIRARVEREGYGWQTQYLAVGVRR